MEDWTPVQYGWDKKSRPSKSGLRKNVPSFKKGKG